MTSFQSTRRGFLGTAALGGAGLLMSGRSWGSSANEKLNIAIIGAGGRGSANIGEMAGENIVALCDVDEPPDPGTAISHPRDPTPATATTQPDPAPNRTNGTNAPNPGTAISTHPGTSISLRDERDVHLPERPQ